MLRNRQLVPPLTIHTPDGRTVRAWDYKQKKNLVIAFLDTDCAPCEEFLRALVASAAALREKEAVALIVFLEQPARRRDRFASAGNHRRRGHAGKFSARVSRRGRIRIARIRPRRRVRHGPLRRTLRAMDHRPPQISRDAQKFSPRSTTSKWPATSAARHHGPPSSAGSRRCASQDQKSRRDAGVTEVNACRERTVGSISVFLLMSLKARAR